MTCRRLAALLPCVVLAGLLAAGCGEKIAIPEAEGLYSLTIYLESGVYPVDDARDLAAVQGNVFVLTRTGLYRRNQAFTGQDSVLGFSDARGLCVDGDGSLLFVWDQGTQTMSWFRTDSLLAPTDGPPSTVLPEVASCTGLATSPVGIEQVSGAETFLYLSDPDSGVVRRYAYDRFTGLAPWGILCRDGGEGTRFVKDAAGLARDSEDSLLVCDRDTARNWVIRFDSEPDVTDTDPDGPDPLRGNAALFDEATCNPPAAADYVLGDAAECGESGWQGGPSDAEGEFDRPFDVTIDGLGRIYVADTGNHRVQRFSAQGRYDLAFGDSALTPNPRAVAVMDAAFDVGPDDIDHGAFLWVIGDGAVRKFISGDHYEHINEQPPPQ